MYPVLKKISIILFGLSSLAVLVLNFKVEWLYLTDLILHLFIHPLLIISFLCLCFIYSSRSINYVLISLALQVLILIFVITVMIMKLLNPVVY
jgi:hypothetical protein